MSAIDELEDYEIEWLSCIRDKVLVIFDVFGTSLENMIKAGALNVFEEYTPSGVLMYAEVTDLGKELVALYKL